jgi:hypothetical protein
MNNPIEQSMPPTTTTQEDMTVAGQRRVNLIWEYTQAAIAILVTIAMIYNSVSGRGNQDVRNAFFLIVGFYFSRTNHTAIGGTGNKPQPPYEGR